MLEAVRLSGDQPQRASRAMAMTSAAVYDALNAVDGASGFLYVRVAAAPGASGSWSADEIAELAG